MNAARSPVPVPVDILVRPGPALLQGIEDGPWLAAHRERYGALPRLGLDELTALVGDVGLRGRGGAAFPFATKLAAAAAGRRPVVVVNLAEGEPASGKDMALALTRPHLVLDGAYAAAAALGARELHVVLPGDRPVAAERMRAALRERPERPERLRVQEHTASPRFVSGQARAVVELLEGRENLPVTAWQPEAAAGLRGRPTLLSNAETWAHVGLLVLRGAADYRRLGTTGEPGTTLLTVTAQGSVPQVHEVELGSPLRDVLPDDDGSPGIVGGFHGSWATAETLSRARVSVPGLQALGIPLGAGVVLLPGPGSCPLQLTSRIVDHLAGQSAGRCGPCLNGLPALAGALRGVLHGTESPARVEQLCGLVVRRGACAHPDGTARLVRSMLLTFPDEIAAHARGGCATRPVEVAS
ncbi:MAG: NADH-ubiquinone oxidoreductase-F iron-sulfur binding region domain-containing protein [Nocardioides sp.]|nr:NADH-ubiquinone oxidoreductase-F iron-sulfur binding region domain-containing protein [Nocardioides sp.]